MIGNFTISLTGTAGSDATHAFTEVLGGGGNTRVELWSEMKAKVTKEYKKKRFILASTLIFFLHILH